MSLQPSSWPATLTAASSRDKTKRLSEAVCTQPLIRPVTIDTSEGEREKEAVMVNGSMGEPTDDNVTDMSEVERVSLSAKEGHKDEERQCSVKKNCQPNKKR